MRSKGSRFTLGGWGLGCVRKTLRHPFATIRHRPYEIRMAVPTGSAATVVTFEGLNSCATSFRVAGVALLVIATCFISEVGRSA